MGARMGEWQERQGDCATVWEGSSQNKQCAWTPAATGSQSQLHINRCWAPSAPRTHRQLLLVPNWDALDTCHHWRLPAVWQGQQRLTGWGHVLPTGAPAQAG